MLRPSTLFFLFLPFILNATTLHIGDGFPYTDLEAAVQDVLPGDTIVYHEGTHPGGQYILELQGTADAWIVIQNAPGETAILDGSTTAIQFVDPAYLKVSGLIFQHQTGNGVNTDDGGDYSTPAHHVIFENCTFRDMSASGNNDLLKLSGLDYFEIRNCTFLNGSSGGSGIDMVGCHHGMIEDNYFENLGSNSIQAKGGTEHIRIEGNFFKDGGQRTLNLGGSTGLQFFRPDTAHFEAANLQVYSNIIVGSWAAVAYVGSVNVEVVNNTIYQPENWVIRILQETVDPERFYECGNNTFRNNIVYLGDNLSTETNIGPNTQPETFTFSNNLWFNKDNTNWGGPNIPVTDQDNILNQNPLFSDADNDDFTIEMNSPAAGTGYPVADPIYDHFNGGFANPPSIGAVEANPVSANEFIRTSPSIQLSPNPTSGNLFLQLKGLTSPNFQIEIYDSFGRMIWERKIKDHFKTTLETTLQLSLEQGIYILGVKDKQQVITRVFLSH